MTPLKIVTISAGLSVPSSTRLLADRLTQAAGLATGSEVETIELRGLAHALADNLLTGFPSGDLAEAIAKVAAADALIVVTPVFSASYSGLFKTFFDVLEMGLLEGKPVLMAATAGTARHSLVLEHALRPLFNYLKAVPVPTAVFAATEDFGDNRSGALQGRIDRAAQQLAQQLAALVGGPVMGPVTDRPARVARVSSSTPRPSFDEESADFVDFEALLAD